MIKNICVKVMIKMQFWSTIRAIQCYIDLTFKKLFEEELICLEEPIKDMLVNYTPLGESADISFEEYMKLR